MTENTTRLAVRSSATALILITDAGLGPVVIFPTTTVRVAGTNGIGYIHAITDGFERTYWATHNVSPKDISEADQGQLDLPGIQSIEPIEG